MAKTAKDRDRALAMAKANDLGLPEAEADGDGDTNMEEGAEEATETLGSKVIVVHIGSQNLRIGLASDALPKTVPMVIARKSTTSESEDHDEPHPKRLKLDDGSLMEPEKMLGPEVCSTQTPGSYFRHFLTICMKIVLIAVYHDGRRTQSTYATKQAQDFTELERNGYQLQSKNGTRDHPRTQ
jgi:hypothetical protein